MKDDDFEWDDAKAAQNWANHGVSFEAARPAVEIGEDRSVLLGMVQGHLLAVVHAQRGAGVRIISGPIGGTKGTTTLP
jgi:uncharacterized DUF497 family protein